jgi:hypothetical protein
MPPRRKSSVTHRLRRWKCGDSRRGCPAARKYRVATLELVAHCLKAVFCQQSAKRPRTVSPWYPPLQRTQGWGTLCRGDTQVSRKMGHPPLRKSIPNTPRPLLIGLLKNSSREAAEECSPRRKSWECSWRGRRAPQGRKKLNSSRDAALSISRNRRRPSHQKEKARLISQPGSYLCRQRPTPPHTFACSTIGPAGLNLRRFAGVGEAGARSRNPERSLRRISMDGSYARIVDIDLACHCGFHHCSSLG